MANRVNSHGPLSKVIRAPSSTRLDANGRDLSESADSEVAYLPCRKPRGSVLQAVNYVLNRTEIQADNNINGRDLILSRCI